MLPPGRPFFIDSIVGLNRWFLGVCITPLQNGIAMLRQATGVRSDYRRRRHHKSWCGQFFHDAFQPVLCISHLRHHSCHNSHVHCRGLAQMGWKGLVHATARELEILSRLTRVSEDSRARARKRQMALTNAREQSKKFGSTEDCVS